jgi:hypothetical protein
MKASPRRRPKPLRRAVMVEADSLDGAIHHRAQALGIVVRICAPSSSGWWQAPPCGVAAYRAIAQAQADRGAVLSITEKPLRPEPAAVPRGVYVHGARDQHVSSPAAGSRSAPPESRSGRAFHHRHEPRRPRHRPRWARPTPLPSREREMSPTTRRTATMVTTGCPHCDKPLTLSLRAQDGTALVALGRGGGQGASTKPKGPQRAPAEAEVIAAATEAGALVAFKNALEAVDLKPKDVERYLNHLVRLAKPLRLPDRVVTLCAAAVPGGQLGVSWGGEAIRHGVGGRIPALQCVGATAPGRWGARAPGRPARGTARGDRRAAELPRLARAPHRDLRNLLDDVS